ncbi:hypothetical protein RCL1_006866 [Eukaryota sp. TZLM3-RCL]
MPLPLASALFTLQPLIRLKSNIVALTAFNNKIVVADDRGLLFLFQLSWISQEDGTLKPALSLTAESKSRIKSRIIEVAYSQASETILVLDEKLRFFDPLYLECTHKVQGSRGSLALSVDPSSTSRFVLLLRRKILICSVLSSSSHVVLHDISISEVPKSLSLLGNHLFLSFSNHLSSITLSDSSYSQEQIMETSSSLITSYGLQKSINQIFLTHQSLGVFMTTTGEATTAPLDFSCYFSSSPNPSPSPNPNGSSSLNVLSISSCFPYFLTSTSVLIDIWIPGFESTLPVQSINVGGQFRPQKMISFVDNQSNQSKVGSISLPFVVVSDLDKTIQLLVPKSFKQHVSYIMVSDPRSATSLYQYYSLLEVFNTKEHIEITKDLLHFYLTTESCANARNFVAKYLNSEHVNALDYCELLSQYFKVFENFDAVFGVLEGLPEVVKNSISQLFSDEEISQSKRALNFLSNQNGRINVVLSRKSMLTDESIVIPFTDFLLKHITSLDQNSQSILTVSKQLMYLICSTLVIPNNRALISKFEANFSAVNFNLPPSIWISLFNKSCGGNYCLALYFFHLNSPIPCIYLCHVAAQNYKNLEENSESVGENFDWLMACIFELLLSTLENLAPNISNFDVISDYCIFAKDYNLPKFFKTLLKVSPKILNSWDLDKIFKFLDNQSNLIIELLEYIILNENISEKYHTLLGFCYVDAINDVIRSNSIKNVEDYQKTTCPKLKKLSQEFLNYLSNPVFNFDTQSILSKISDQIFLHEKVALYCRLGFHNEALELLSTLENFELGQQYCHSAGKSRTEVGMFLLIFFKFLLVHQNMSSVLTFLDQERDLVPLQELIACLPDSTNLSELFPFISTILRKNLSLLNSTALEKSLRQVSERKLASELIQLERSSVCINQNSRCDFCRERIGTIVFAVYPGSILVHSKCIVEFEKKRGIRK